MKMERQKKLARSFVFLAALVVVLCTGLLVLDYLKMRHQAPLDKAIVKSMEEAVQTDAEVAVKLTEERAKQTEQSLQRDSRNLLYGYCLLAGAAIFLISMNWLQQFEDEPILPLEALLRLRSQTPPSFATAGSTAGKRDFMSTPEIDLSCVEDILSKEGRKKEAAIPILRAIQTHYGYLPDEALRKVCEETEITPAQIAGASTFYAQFRLSPVGRHIVKLCHGTACHVSGISQITEELQRRLVILPGEDTDQARLFTLERVACLGCCSLAPVMMIDEETAGRLTPASACEALHNFRARRSE